MSEITISQLSKSTGLSSSAIRYYVQEGLIHTIGRDGLQRVFHDSVLQQLKLIILGKKAGFSLVEIKQMMANKQEPINKALLTLKAKEIKQKIIALQVLHNTLEHVANCPHQNPLECEKFQKILNQVF